MSIRARSSLHRKSLLARLVHGPEVRAAHLSFLGAPLLDRGESHGPALVVTVEGSPPDSRSCRRHRRRTRPAAARVRARPADALRAGRGRVPRRGPARPHAGLAGRDPHPQQRVGTGKWHEEMSSAPGRTEKPLTQPRPGHADLAGMQKYGFTDARNVLERASARETAARVAAGRWPRSSSSQLGIAVLSHVIQLGAAQRRPTRRPQPDDLAARRHVRGPLLRHRRRARDDPRDQGSGQGRRLARRCRRGARLRRAARPRLARPLGPPHRRLARAGTDEHPGDEGRRDRRGLRRSRAGAAAMPTTRSRGTRARGRTGASRRVRAGSKAE